MASYNDTMKKEFKTKLEENPYGKSIEENAQKNGQKLTPEEKETVGRLNFPDDVRITLGARVGFKCSKCGQVTLGPNGKNDFVILGEAAHIYGATLPKDGKSTRIPRPAPAIVTEEYIKSLDNGIWLCRNHHRLIDAIWSNEKHTPSELKQWKKEAEEKQEKDLDETKEPAIEEFFDRLPNFLCKSKVDPNDFKDEDWLIILFVESRGFNSDRDMFAYVSWLNSNGIKLKTAGVEKDWNNHWMLSDYERRLNNLASVIIFDEEGMYSGDNYEALCEDLYDIDPNYHELILDELRAKY